MAQLGTVYESGMVMLPGACTLTDLSAKQYFGVKHAGTFSPQGPNVALMAADTDTPLGVLQNTPVGTATAPATCNVAMEGIVKCVAGAAITAGVPVQFNSAGKCITAAATGHVVGVAITQAGADLDLISVQLNIAPSPIKA